MFVTLPPYSFNKTLSCGNHLFLQKSPHSFLTSLDNTKRNFKKDKKYKVIVIPQKTSFLYLDIKE